MYVTIHIYTYTHTNTHVCACVCKCICVYVDTCIFTVHGGLSMCGLVLGLKTQSKTPSPHE